VSGAKGFGTHLLMTGQGDLQWITCDALDERRLDMCRAPLVLDRADADGDRLGGDLLEGRFWALAVDLNLNVVVHQTIRSLEVALAVQAHVLVILDRLAVDHANHKLGVGDLLDPLRDQLPVVEFSAHDY
jgi:hypothetical protein